MLKRTLTAFAVLAMMGAAHAQNDANPSGDAPSGTSNRGEQARPTNEPGDGDTGGTGAQDRDGGGNNAGDAGKADKSHGDKDGKKGDKAAHGEGKDKGERKARGEDDHGDAKEPTPLTDETVLNMIHATNQKEIKMGQLGQEKGSSAEAKSFGQKLVTDHTAADEKVKATAQQVGVTLKEGEHDMKPADKNNNSVDEAGDDEKGERQEQGRLQTDSDEAKTHSDKMAKLKTLEGEAFDQEYGRMMAKAHAKVIMRLQKAQQSPNVTEPVKNLITQLLPGLQEHQKIAEGLAGEAVAEKQDQN